MRPRHHPLRRAGFTLVELLVVMALCTLTMAILTEAFVQGLATFRQLKALGDLQENMRQAIVPLRHDLLQRHFDGTQKLAVSFANYSRPTRGFVRIQQGAITLEGVDGDGILSFRTGSHVLHMTVVSVGARRADWPTADAPGVTNPANPALDPSRWLWAQGPSDYREPGVVIPNSTPPAYYPTQRGALISQWSEVMWFLSPMIDPDTGVQAVCSESDTLLWNLHRRHRLLVVDNADKLNSLASPDRIDSVFLPAFADVASKPDFTNAQPNKLFFGTPESSILPLGRSMMDALGIFSLPHPVGTPYPPTSTGAAYAPAAIALGVNPFQESPAKRGDDRIIPDVISFEIRVLIPGSFEFETIPELQARLGLPVSGIYDTAVWPVNNPNAGPVPPSGPGGVPQGLDGIPPNLVNPNLSLTIKAIQVTLRVWDAKSQQTRQITMIQDM